MQNEGQGFQKIGGPTMKIVKSLESMIAPSNQQHTNSVISGTPHQARKGSNLTGTLHGGTSVVTTRSGPPSVWQTDQMLVASFPPSVSLWLRANEEVETVIGADGQFEEARLLGYGGKVCPNADAAGMIAASMVPLSRADTLKELAGLKALTKSRAEQGADLKLMLAGFAARLDEFPADVVLEACRRWGNRETFFPAWAELRAECQQLVRWRWLTAEALNG